MAALVLVLSALAVPALCQGPMSGFPPRPKAITGCTLSSFTAPSWFIQDFQTSSGAASFGLLNRATNQTTAVSCEASGSCSAKNSTSLHTSVVQLSSTKTQLLVSDSWTCHDRNVRYVLHERLSTIRPACLHACASAPASRLPPVPTRRWP